MKLKNIEKLIERLTNLEQDFDDDGCGEYAFLVRESRVLLSKMCDLMQLRNEKLQEITTASYRTVGGDMSEDIEISLQTVIGDKIHKSPRVIKSRSVFYYETEERKLNIIKRVDGFNPLEVLGIAQWDVQDVVNQMKGLISPNEASREVVKKTQTKRLNEG